FVFLAIVAAIQTAIYRADDFTFKNPASSRWGKWFYEWHLEVLWGLAFILAILFSDETKRNALYMLSALVWVRLALYVYGHTVVKKSVSNLLGLLLVGLPAFMILMVGWGRDTAYSDLKDTKDYYRLQLKDKTIPQQVKLLRVLDKGALVLNHQN